MIEFETFCFLQNHKTGCTLVERFLAAHCRERLLFYDKHFAPPARVPGKYHLVAVREPLDAYLSLFNYGLDGLGEALVRLRAIGRGELYARGIAGFPEWLDFVLSPDAGAVLYPPDCAWMAPRHGLLTARFIRLAVPGSAQRQDDRSWRAELQGPGAVDRVLRFESLLGELAEVASGPLRHAFADPHAAKAWLAAAPRVNASTRRDSGQPPALPPALARQLVEREALIYDAFYPARAPCAG